MSSSLTPLLQVENLTRYFTSGIFRPTRVKAVDDVSFCIEKGETLALVGESGSGKTTLGRLVLQLLRPTSGRVFFNGRDLVRVNGDMRALRRSMQIIFQDSDGSLNPGLNVRNLLLEPLRLQRINSISHEEHLENLMGMVNLTPDLLQRHPHELSGGQRQRLGIARAMSLNPQFVVADEPAASLDRSVQAQILALMKDFQISRKVAYLYISHDLRTVRMLAHRIAVMYRGKFMEYGPAATVFQQPSHPYTRLLLNSAPGCRCQTTKEVILNRAETTSNNGSCKGCLFAHRCFEAASICFRVNPKKQQVRDRHWIWCHKEPV